ncbi:PH domain-containing protein [Aphelenchoides besseyi]|nr:PH domain-containing protein [Aphelenchoides besseyi]KAI6223329.1 PH domain-containing protein [Aphelenchoides besseyi]
MFSSCTPSFCSGSEEIADARRVKDGELLRYKTGFFGNKWVKCYVCLLSDGRLLIFNTNTDSKANGYFHVKEAAPMMCVGMMTERLRAKRPSLPSDCSIHHLVGISLDEKGEKAYWLLFPSDAELEDWLGQIAKLLPRPDQQFAGPTPPQMPNLASSSNPAPVPGGFQNQQPGYYGPNQGPQNTTIIVESQGNQSSGMGIAGGMAVGALAGFGIGTFFAAATESAAHETAGIGATAAVAPAPVSQPAIEEVQAPAPEDNFIIQEQPAPIFSREEPQEFGGYTQEEANGFGGFGDEEDF